MDSRNVVEPAYSLDLNFQALWIVSLLCLIALVFTFYRMKGGFGPQNLRAVGIVFIVTLVAILSLARSEDLTTAMGILGAVAGYLFGSQRSPGVEAQGSSVNAAGATFGDAAEIAGRDINKTIDTIETMKGDIETLKDSVVNLISQDEGAGALDYLFLSEYVEHGEPISGLAKAIKEKSTSGWRLLALSQSYDRRGMVAVLQRGAGGGLVTRDAGNIYHGLEETQLA